MSDLKLLPCPFCGSENIAAGSDKGTVYRHNTAFGDLTRSVPTVRWAYCVDCGCVAPAEKVNNFDGFYKPDEQEDALNRAISAWNRRAQPAACEIAEYAEDCKDCGFCAQPANEPLTLNEPWEMLERPEAECREAGDHLDAAADAHVIGMKQIETTVDVDSSINRFLEWMK